MNWCCTTSPGCTRAAARWAHPVRGLVPPADFIAIAKESALVADIGARIIAHACRQYHAWGGEGMWPTPNSCTRPLG